MAEEEPVQEQTREPWKGAGRQQSSKGLVGVLTGLGLLALGKLKGVLLLLKALPVSKLLLTSGSMLLMVVAEAARSGVAFGVGFVLLIMLHELGHGYAMRKHGVSAGWPIFIPFFGAMIAMRNTPIDRNVEAEIAFGGPYVGTMASIAAAALGLYLQSRFMLSLAYAGAFLNLFNLTPLSPLDGGRVVQAFSRKAWILGMIVMVGMLLTTGTPLLILILLMALPRIFKKDDEARATLTTSERQIWAVRYFGLCAFLALFIYFAGRLIHHA